MGKRERVWFSRKLYRLCKVQELIKFLTFHSVHFHPGRYARSSFSIFRGSGFETTHTHTHTHTHTVANSLDTFVNLIHRQKSSFTGKESHRNQASVRAVRLLVFAFVSSGGAVLSATGAKCKLSVPCGSSILTRMEIVPKSGRRLCCFVLDLYSCRQGSERGGARMGLFR